ncbi:MAG: M56 family metallopeptidase [Lacrimispora sp.]|uniref:M56 family metallopeptidase n=1 Tax=Lacrimispora sp. TaxID=2719234 RepID=UPI0039E59623
MVNRIMFGYLPKLTTLLSLLTGRILFAAFVLAILIGFIMQVRRKLSPAIRSWQWGLCLLALFIPFERSAIIIAQELKFFPFMQDGTIADIPLLYWTFKLWSLIWFFGFIFSALKTHRAHKYTLRLLKEGKMTGCAAYFYRGRSHIYLPPEFKKAYTSTEQAMLIAHEKQHIKHHDPLLYRFLQVVQCVFWFCPFIHKALRLIRQDRELLCDERASSGFSKREYGMLLLREAQKEVPGRAVAGIVSEPSGVYERVQACVSPFPGNTKAAVRVVCIAAAMFAVGFIGIIKPVVSAPMDIRVFLADDKSFLHIEGTERFVLLKQGGIALAQQELYEYAISVGLKPEQRLNVSVLQGERPTLVGFHTVNGGGWFLISELKSKDIFFPYYDEGFNLWSVLFKGL